MSIGPTRVRRRLTDYQRFFVRYRAFMSELAEERQRGEHLFRSLSQGSYGTRRNLVRRLLADRRLHRLFAFDALHRTNQLWIATPDSVEQLADRFNAFSPIYDESVASRWVSKGSGRRRVQIFGARRRMQQSFVARILRSLHPPPDNQKLFNGGMPKARRAIEAAVAEGYRYGVEADFVGFYTSLRPERLSELLRPLPTSVVDAVVWDATARRTIRSGDAALPHPTSSAFEGLSLGSACSPIVGEIVISQVLAAAQLSDVVTFADNLLVLGRSEEDMVAKIQALRDAAGNRLFGSLELRVPKERNFDLDFDFDFTKQRGVLRDGEVQWSPGHQKLDQYQVSVASRLTLPEIEVAERRVEHWTRAYPDWHNGPAFEAEYLAALAVRRFYLARHPKHLSEAVTAVVKAFYERREVDPGFNGGLLHFVPEEGDILGDGYSRLTSALDRLVQDYEEAA